jgi:hypothetical protein
VYESLSSVLASGRVELEVVSVPILLGVRRAMPESSSEMMFFDESPLLRPLKLKPFFFADGTGNPVIELAISRILCEIGESWSTRGVAVFCICRTAA